MEEVGVPLSHPLTGWDEPHHPELCDSWDASQMIHLDPRHGSRPKAHAATEPDLRGLGDRGSWVVVEGPFRPGALQVVGSCANWLWPGGGVPPDPVGGSARPFGSSMLRREEDQVEWLVKP